MPTFNLTPILFPKPKKDNVYDMLKDLLQIQEKQFAIDEGGEIQNPASYDPLIEKYEVITNDPTISANDRRDAQKMLNTLTIRKLKTDLDQKKRLDAGDLKQMVNQDLRELEFEFPGNPIAYSTGAMMKYNDILYGTAEWEGLNQLISILETNAVDVTELRAYQLVCQEELSKYSDIMDAYETGDMNRLSEYAVVYTPYAGKVRAMRIIFKGDTDPSHSQKTNLRYSRDVAGNLAMVSDTGEPAGMQVYFIRANATMGDKYSFGNSNFVYGITGWETKDSAVFDYKKIKHAPLHSVPSGSFVKDSKEKLYYVNRDRSFHPVGERHKEELGFAEDKVYHLSPDEEINLLPGAIDHSTFPVMERYNREASMSDFSYWSAFGKELGKEIKKPSFLYKYPYELPKIGEKIGEEVRKGARSLWDITKEAWGKGVEQLRKPKEIKETPSWGLEEVGKLPTLEESKKFIKKLGI